MNYDVKDVTEATYIFEIPCVTSQWVEACVRLGRVASSVSTVTTLFPTTSTEGIQTKLSENVQPLQEIHWIRYCNCQQ